MEGEPRWRAVLKAAVKDALNVAAYCWCCSFPMCATWELHDASDASDASDDRADRCALEAARGITALERYLQDAVH